MTTGWTRKGMTAGWAGRPSGMDAAAEGCPLSCPLEVARLTAVKRLEKEDGYSCKCCNVLFMVQEV